VNHTDPVVKWAYRYGERTRYEFDSFDAAVASAVYHFDRGTESFDGIEEDGVFYSADHPRVVEALRKAGW
jgi:hypothetical protein